MATTKAAAGSGTTTIAKKTPGRVPAKQAAGTGASLGASAKTPAKQTATRKSATKKSATMAGATSTAPPVKSLAKKTAVTKAATPRSSAAKSATGAVPTSKAASKSAAKATTPKTTATGASAGRSRKISPEQALANTRGLLEAKREHARQPQSWQAIGPSHGHPGSEGFQSPAAMDKAEELHAAESHLTPIQGSVSTRDRHNQGKRDSR